MLGIIAKTCYSFSFGLILTGYIRRLGIVTNKISFLHLENRGILAIHSYIRLISTF